MAPPFPFIFTESNYMNFPGSLDSQLSTPAPAGIQVPINLMLTPDGQVSSLRELLPKGTRIVPTVPDLAASDSPDIERLRRCYQVIPPKGASIADMIALLAGASGVEQVGPGPQISLPGTG